MHGILIKVIYQTHYDPFYALSPRASKALPIKYINTLIRGKWSKPAIKFKK